VTDEPGRQARLRPEYALLYPGLEPGVWEDADDLAEQLLTQHLLRPSPGFMLSGRVLPVEHFEFRGGDAAGRPRIARTRRDDQAI
jgi:3-methyladenine DNA glycosylase Mpg